MKKIVAVLLIVSIAAGALTGCTRADGGQTSGKDKISGLDFQYRADPETMSLEVEAKGVRENASLPLPKEKVSDFHQAGDKSTWSYEEKGIEVEMEKVDDYLDVTISSTKENENIFAFPAVSAEAYLLPMDQGKYFTAKDVLWKDYLKDKTMKPLNEFSMQFFAADKEDYSILYIAKNPYNNEIKFDIQEDIQFTFHHEFPSINEKKEYGFRIYVTEKNIVDTAKLYKNYVVEAGEFKTLAAKAEENQNIEKLYGAPHVYFWDQSVISEENIKWDQLRKSMPEKVKNWICELLSNTEDGESFVTAFQELGTTDYTDKYTKNLIVQGFGRVLGLKEFYNEEVFGSTDEDTKNLDQLEQIAFNKKILKKALGAGVDPVEKWADANTVDILADMKNSGMENVWIGLDDWRSGFYNPEFVSKANELGYLIGTYDSYHSIHKPGEEEWITAKFEDTSLYENATVEDKNGDKLTGFQGVGRKLNPILAFPSVKQRVSSILDTGLQFNSWFLDTDATGEVFDDYSPGHTTTEEEDIKARLERMDYLSKEKNMVVGSEGGNDFANKSLAFAHGIETPAFSWMDPDTKNKESEYYLGRYYSATNGVPELFSKVSPVKEELKELFLDTKYTVPLYKLVYNDSVVTTYWWGWGTLKIQDEAENRMLYEVLYNVPPLYHLDKQQWALNKETIVNHTKVWSAFSKKAINQEMTDFEILSEDRTLQMTEYGNDLKVIANFANTVAEYDGEKIGPKSLLILDGADKTSYTPAKFE